MTDIDRLPPLAETDLGLLRAALEWAWDHYDAHRESFDAVALNDLESVLDPDKLVPIDPDDIAALRAVWAAYRADTNVVRALRWLDEALGNVEADAAGVDNALGRPSDPLARIEVLRTLPSKSVVGRPYVWSVLVAWTDRAPSMFGPFGIEAEADAVAATLREAIG